MKKLLISFAALLVSVSAFALTPAELGTLKGALQASWRRTANRAEAALATGTGTSGDPATMTFEGNISQYDVSMIRSVP